MSIKARINDKNEFLIAGELIEDRRFIRLDTQGNLFVGKVFTELSALDDNSLVDDDHLIDDDYLIDDNQSMSSFLSWLYGIEIAEIKPNKVYFLDEKYVIANEIKEKQTLEDG